MQLWAVWPDDQIKIAQFLHKLPKNGQTSFNLRNSDFKKAQNVTELFGLLLLEILAKDV